MKLSDAILLGSTVLAPQAGRQYSAENKSGCALGMAAIAQGCTFGTTTTPVAEQDRRTLGTEGVWGGWVLEIAERPCDCWRFRVPREMRIKDIIAHLFDRHVTTRKDWTLERLVAWVKHIEPDEPPDPVAEIRQNLSRTRHAEFFSMMEDRNRPSPEELQEWQGVRQAFAGKHPPRRRGPRA